MRAMKRSSVSRFSSRHQTVLGLEGWKLRIAIGITIAGLGANGCGSDGETANADGSSGGQAQGGDSGAGGQAGEDGGAGSNTGGSSTGGASSGGTSSGGTQSGGASGEGGEGGASGEGGEGGNGTLTVDDCFNDISGGVTIDYDQYGPVVGTHCLGTNHQDIVGVERVVFLGDSVTEGTPPSYILDVVNNHFRALLGGAAIFGIPTVPGTLQNTFPDIEVDNCAKWGARTDDFIRSDGQAPQCWPELFAGGQPKPVSEASDSRTTLVIFTMGGNDIFNWADNSLEGQAAMDASEKAAQYLEDVVAFFKEPGRFPNGIHVIYGNPYEYTDATGDTGSCTASAVVGLQGNQMQLAPAVTHFTERYLEIAVKYQADMIFMLENFCGHGFHHQDTASQCYRGPGAELWFDFTCIHPNDAGHAELARMFQAVVDE